MLLYRTISLFVCFFLSLLENTYFSSTIAETFFLCCCLAFYVSFFFILPRVFLLFQCEISLSLSLSLSLSICVFTFPFRLSLIRVIGPEREWAAAQNLDYPKTTSFSAKYKHSFQWLDTFKFVVFYFKVLSLNSALWGEFCELNEESFCCFEIGNSFLMIFLL